MTGWVDIQPHPAGIHIWNVFSDVMHSRKAKFAPITWSELKAYLDLMDIHLSPQDVNMLRELDRTYLNSIPSD